MLAAEEESDALVVGGVIVAEGRTAMQRAVACAMDSPFSRVGRLAGGRVVLDPAIRVHYPPRGSLEEVFRQYYEYGLWKVPVMLKQRQQSSPRSFAPLIFVSLLVAHAPAAVLSRVGRRVLGLELGACGALADASAGISIHGRCEFWSLLPRVTIVFPVFHSGYGIGMLRGWIRAAAVTAAPR
jgi:succinoglycan biosynthesis protein ExoA